MIGERLVRARAASGLSMRDLGERVGVSANMIKKYEHNESMPTSGKLLKIAKSLGVRSEYFFRPVKVELKNIEYRKRANTPKGILKKIEADVLDQAERWQELANIWPEFPIQPFEVPDELPTAISSLSELEDFAVKVRSAWGLGLNPIPDLIDEIESHGLLVIITNIDENAKFDGLQATVEGNPVIVVSSNWPGDRQRFTLAHELGHFLLRGRLGADIDEEKACHRFAASFLLPACAVRQSLGLKRHNIEMQELFLLKKEYGLSMQACLYRAKDLAIISESVCKKIFFTFVHNGWRKKEPGEPLRSEETILFQQLVYRALGEGVVGESKAAELLSMSLMDFHHARKLTGAVNAAVN
ncbi:MAG: transcriptional regulator [Gammaproteobacteria bacterium]|nr:MAG: transcriptional regulator [Gammaproteobacteria bacterium]